MSKSPGNQWTVVALIIGALLQPACSNELSELSEAERSGATVAIYAAATRHLLEVDSTFGPDHRFSTVLVEDRIHPDTRDNEGPSTVGDPLTVEQRAAIEDAVSLFAPVRFISDSDEFIDRESGWIEPVIAGSAIVTLGRVTFDRKGATVRISLWCGGVCGIWLTYRVLEEADGWRVVGTEGPIAVS